MENINRNTASFPNSIKTSTDSDVHTGLLVYEFNGVEDILKT